MGIPNYGRCITILELILDIDARCGLKNIECFGKISFIFQLSIRQEELNFSFQTDKIIYKIIFPGAPFGLRDLAGFPNLYQWLLPCTSDVQQFNNPLSWPETVG
jgi:hypothetical protein